MPLPGMPMKMNTRKIALSAMLSALSLVLLAGASMMPTGRVALAVFAGIPVLLASVAGGGTCGMSVYLVTGALSLLVLPGKAMAVAYVTLFGAYPAVQYFVENRWQWGKRIKMGIKFVSFLVLMFLLCGCAVAFFGFEQYVTAQNILIAAGGSIILFFVYDKGLILVVNMLYKRMKPLFDKVSGQKGNRL